MKFWTGSSTVERLHLRVLKVAVFKSRPVRECGGSSDVSRPSTLKRKDGGSNPSLRATDEAVRSLSGCEEVLPRHQAEVAQSDL